MDIILTHQEQREPICFNPFSILSYWVSKSTKKLCKRARISSGFCCRGLDYKGMMVNNSTFCSSPVFLEEVAEKCDAFGEKSGSNSDESSSSSSSSTLMGWPVHRKAAEEGDFDGGEMEREVSSMSERFSKLLLGEDIVGIN